MRSARVRPNTIDEYLALLEKDQRTALQRLRRSIHAAAPQAEERISYGLPAFRLNGRMLVAFGAAESHCAFYPMSGSTVEAHQENLKSYATSKGTIRFSTAEPLPAALVRKRVMCLTNGWSYVAPKMAGGEARRASIAVPTRRDDRGATKPQAIFGTPLRDAGLFASRFVARSFQTRQGYARRSSLAGGQNPLRHNTSHL